MKKSILILILSVLFTLNLYAQLSTSLQQYRIEILVDYANRNGGNTGDIIDYLDDEYTGSPYGNPIFLLGNIYENNKLVMSNYALRYNAMTDEIEVKETLYIEDSESKALSKSPDLYVKIMGDMMVFVPANEVIENPGYFQVKHIGTKYNLYKKIAKKYYPAKKARNSFENDVPAKFDDKSVYYLVTQDGKFEEFGSSKSKKLKLFGNKQAEIKKYVSNGKLDFNDENDLIKIVNYYDTISESTN
jgi:hypothetical protein